jgi:hypothetical protein
MQKKISFSILKSINKVYEKKLLSIKISEKFKTVCLSKKEFPRRINFLPFSKNSKILGNSNIILNSDNYAGIDSIVFSYLDDKVFGLNHTDFDLSNNKKLKFSYKYKKKLNKGIFIGSYNNIGHWIYNHLLRLIFIDDSIKDLPILVSDNEIPNRFLDFIKLIGFKKNEIIILNKSTLYLIDEVYIPLMPWHIIDSTDVYFIPECIHFLRQFTIRSNISLSENLFISRKRAAKRILINEDEVFLKLSKYNFKKIFLEDLSLEEQIKLGNQAKNVISPWGASVNFFIFMNKGSNLFQLGARNKMNITPIFCKYAEVNCIDVKGKLINQEDELDSDFYINVDELDIVLNKFLG